MNNMLHDILNKLRVISKIKEGDKLDTTNDLNIFKYNIYNWFWRVLQHDNKDEGTKYLQNLYTSINQATEQLINNARNANEEKKAKLQDIVINLAIQIKKSITGIENLSKSYKNFPKTSAILEGIVQDYAVVTFKQLIEILPDETLIKNKELLTPIVYCGNTLYSSHIKSDENEI